MINIKNYKAGCIFLLSIFLLSGCKKDFLNRSTLGQYSSDNYPYPSGGGPYDQYVYAAYGSLKSDGTGNNAVSGFNFLGATAIRADDDDKGSSPTDSPDQIAMDGFPVTPTNGLIDGLWKGYLSSISACNNVLAQVAKDHGSTDQSVKDLAMAEARFIRGYDYFMLVKLWANVPLIDTVSTVGTSNIPQSTPDQIYAFIESDLKYAAGILPSAWGTKFPGRSTNGTANGLLAKVYLYEKKYDLAKSTAELVMNSGMYNLSTPYNVIFTENGENSSESVFEIQAFADASHKEDLNYGCQYTNVQGVRGSDAANLGWGFNIPSATLDAAYEAGDPRKAVTFLYCPGTYNGESFPAEPNPYYNGKEYTSPAVRASVGDMFGWWMDIRILRYADVVLIDAEASVQTGDIATALADIEMVRARARNGNAGVLPEVTTTDPVQLMLAVQHERRIELAMENERFFDCVRWGIDQSAENSAGKSNYQSSRDKLLPIPQQELDLSAGVLKQNPGY